MKWMLLCCYLAIAALSSIGYANNLIIGTDQINPPMAKKVDSASHFIGFEIDVMNEICSRLKLTCTYQAVVANQIIDELEAQKIDLAMDSIVIPTFRLDGLIFSLPYLPANGQFMTLKTSKITKVSEIADKTIGVSLGALQLNLESDMYLKHIFKKKLDIKGYHNMAELMAALENKQVDVIFANQVALNYWYNNNNLYKFIGAPINTGNGYGILATAKFEQLIVVINDTINQMMNDGTYAKIYQRYFTVFQ